MEKEVVAAIVGALGGLISGAIAAMVTLKAKRIDQIVETAKLWVGAYETKLLEQRLVEYKKLWKLTHQTSRRLIAKLDLSGAQTLADRLTSWYYDDGGIVLSEEARTAFFSARRSLEPSGDDKASDQWRATVVEAFSTLRKALCEDMNSRRGPTLRSSEDGG